MPDERQDSIRQGISAPAESPQGSTAEAERQKRAGAGPPIGGGMGGTSDAERPGDAARLDAEMSDSTEADAAASDQAGER